MGIEKYASPDDYTDDDYWDDLIYEKKPDSSRAPAEGLNVVVTMTSWRGSNDIYNDTYFFTDDELEEYLTIQYLYWNGLRVYQDGRIEQIREYADGGEESIYIGKYGGRSSVFEHGNKDVYEAHQDLIAARKKAEEDAKAAAKAERAAKKAAKEKAEYERLRAKFEAAARRDAEA